MKILTIFGISIITLGFAYIVWGSQKSYLGELPTTLDQLYPSENLSAEPIQPIPQKINIKPALVTLGKKLFADTRLSEEGFSCSSCHNLDEAGNDDRKVSINIRGGNDLMNTPTIFNVGLNPLVGWFGHNKTLEQQIDGVLANKKHMGGNWNNIIDRLVDDVDYRDQFAKLFSDGITRKNIKYAIASFERTLITPNSSFDKYLRGDVQAINDEQKSGYKLFKQYGCIACHQGINIGGNLHARLGTFTSPFKAGQSNSAKRKFNHGRYNVTNDENDKHVFRVPSLRNVAKTAPYFHSGAINNLENAVKFMAKYQIGREISNKDAHLIAEFLHSLTGEYEGRPL